MPSRPKRPCNKPGCAALVTSGYCDDHKQAGARIYDQWRGTPTSRGYGSDWQRVRQFALKRDDYLCVFCRANGRPTPAQDVDHIVPISVDFALRLELSNLQSLCHPCHMAKTAKERLTVYHP